MCKTVISHEGGEKNRSKGQWEHAAAQSRPWALYRGKKLQVEHGQIEKIAWGQFRQAPNAGLGVLYLLYMQIDSSTNLDSRQEIKWYTQKRGSQLVRRRDEGMVIPIRKAGREKRTRNFTEVAL